MTQKESEIITYLENYRRSCTNADIRTALGVICKAVEEIIESRGFMPKSHEGNCKLCSKYTKHLVKGQYCSLCFDQFID